MRNFKNLETKGYFPNNLKTKRVINLKYLKFNQLNYVWYITYYTWYYITFNIVLCFKVIVYYKLIRH